MRSLLTMARRITAVGALSTVFLIPTMAPATALDESRAAVPAAPAPVPTNSADAEDQLFVGVSTDGAFTFPGITIEASWLRGGVEVGTSMDYTPVAADRNRILTRVLVLSDAAGPIMQIRQTFVNPVL